jgi:hypothetical protein
VLLVVTPWLFPLAVAAVVAPSAAVRNQAAPADLHLLDIAVALAEIPVRPAVLDQAVVVGPQQCCRSTELPKL